MFDQIDDGKVIVLDAPALAEHSRTRQATALCPVGAIRVHGN